jgi:hypothetical protein
MGRDCGIYDGEERFWWGKLKKRDHLVDLGLDGSRTLNISSRSGILN